MYNVFVYGTLMYKDRLESVIGPLNDIRIIPGLLYGYEPKTIPDVKYPGLKVEYASRTNGFILSGVTDEQLATMDFYESEGNLYHRILVDVIGENKERYKCFTYFYPHDTSHVVWLPDDREVLIHG